MRTLVVDLSPVLYSNLISASSEVKRNGAKPLPTGKLEYDYEDIVLYKVFEELSQLKAQFLADEVILAADNPKGGYWRKNVYTGYKNKRAKSRKESDINWDEAFATFDKVKNVINESTSFKLVDVETTEGDDVAFVLSKYLSAHGHTVILHSLDHDWIQCLKYDNVEYFRTRKAQKKAGEYMAASLDEIAELELEHCIIGDPGDGFGHIKQWSKFSPEFIEHYPHYRGKELDLWPKRFEIDSLYEDKTGNKAYKHPRYGWKTFKKEFGLHNYTEMLKENKIYRLNYECNKSLAMQDEIPQEITNSIIQSYTDANSTRDVKVLQEFFMKNQLFSLTGSVSLL
jgi:hypothetical protein